MSAIFVYITVPAAFDARNLAATLVTDRLAACANILPGMKSIYHWEGKIEEAEETVVLLKTRDTLFPAVEARVKELHPYETPCITALPVTAAHKPYLEWILGETKP